MSELTTQHLWEPEHPYYCSTGNWDWDKPDAGVMGTLTLYFIRQRKGYNYSLSVPVHPDEEPEVRDYLQERLEHLLTLWVPLTVATGAED